MVRLKIADLVDIQRLIIEVKILYISPSGTVRRPTILIEYTDIQISRYPLDKTLST